MIINFVITSCENSYYVLIFFYIYIYTHTLHIYIYIHTHTHTQCPPKNVCTLQKGKICKNIFILNLLNIYFIQIFSFPEVGIHFLTDSLSGKLLKLVEQFTYLDSNISSSEINFNIHIAKRLTATDKLSVICQSDLSNKIKWNSFQAVAVSVILYGCTFSMLMKSMEKKLAGNYTRMLHTILNKSLKQYSHKTVVVWPLTFHLLKTSKTYRTLLEK